MGKRPRLPVALVASVTFIEMYPRHYSYRTCVCMWAKIELVQIPQKKHHQWDLELSTNLQPQHLHHYHHCWWLCCSFSRISLLDSHDPRSQAWSNPKSVPRARFSWAAEVRAGPFGRGWRGVEITSECSVTYIGKHRQCHQYMGWLFPIYGMIIPS